MRSFIATGRFWQGISWMQPSDLSLGWGQLVKVVQTTQSPWQWQWLYKAMTSLQRKKDDDVEEEDDVGVVVLGGGGCLWLYKTSAASQLMPQHSATAKGTDARGRKSSLQFHQWAKAKNRRSQSSEIVMLPAGANKWEVAERPREMEKSL